jgi:hypothetical protein
MEEKEFATTHLPNELNLEMDVAQEKEEEEEEEEEEEGEEGNIDRKLLKHSS